MFLCFDTDIVLIFLTGAVFGVLLRLYLKTSNKYCESNNVPFSSNKVSASIFSSLCLILTIIFIPTLTVLLLLLAFYRGIIYLILKSIYKNKFGGFFSGNDATWLLEDQSKSIINSILILEEKDNMEKTIFETVKQSVLNEVRIGKLKGSKICMRFKIRMGYAFYIKDEFDFANCIREFDTDDDPHREYITQEGLQKTLSKFGNKSLPYNHSVFTEILVSKRPIVWTNSNKKKCFVVIVRLHHSLGDGISIFKMITTGFSYKPLKVMCEKMDNHKNNNADEECKYPPQILLENYLEKQQTAKSNGQKESFTDLILRYCTMTRSFFLFLFFVVNSLLIQVWLRPSDKNPLHGPKLSDQKAFFWKTENEENLIPIIKRLKQRIKGAFFLDILLTGLSASIREYLKKKTNVLPKYISAITPDRMKFTENKLKCEKSSTNNFTAAIMNIPISTDDNNSKNQDENISLIPILRETIKQTHVSKKSIGYHTNYWTLNIINKYVPVFLLQIVFKFSQYTMFFSNLPGPQTFSIFDELPVRDMIFWITNTGYIGVGVSCLSYDNRMQLGIIIDKTLLSAEDNPQEILDNIPIHIMRFEKEICGREILCEDFNNSS